MIEVVLRFDEVARAAEGARPVPDIFSTDNPYWLSSHGEIVSVTPVPEPVVQVFRVVRPSGAGRINATQVKAAMRNEAWSNDEVVQEIRSDTKN